MATTDKNEKPERKQMPKGGRKGGTSYPRHSLADAVPWAKKLVAKSHLSAQPQDVVYAGVVGAKSGTGNVKISALRKFGLLEGEQATGYSATELAKQINSAASDDELLALKRQAALMPSAFKQVYETFQGDTVSRAKLKQRASGLGVHPDETDNFVDVYTKSLETARLLSIDADQITHVSATDLEGQARGEAASEPKKDEGDSGRKPSQDFSASAAEEQRGDGGAAAAAAAAIPAGADQNGQTSRRATVTVNINVDSSLDTEKLAKQLELLKRFGAI